MKNPSLEAAQSHRFKAFHMLNLHICQNKSAHPPHIFGLIVRGKTLSDLTNKRLEKIHIIHQKYLPKCQIHGYR